MSSFETEVLAYKGILLVAFYSQRPDWTSFSRLPFRVRGKSMNEHKAGTEWKVERMKLLNTIKRQKDYAERLTKRFKLLQNTLLRQQSVLDQYQKTLLKVRFPLHAIREEQRTADILDSTDFTEGVQQVSTSPSNSSKGNEFCSRRQIPEPELALQPASVHKNHSTRNENISNQRYEEDTENIEPVDKSSDGDKKVTTKEHAKFSERDKPQWIQCKRSSNVICKDISSTKKCKLDDSMKCNVMPRPARMHDSSAHKKLLPKHKQSDYSYIEVIRNRDVRATLPAHDCRDCSKYYDAIEKMDFPMRASDSNENVKSHKMKCSRHRARFEPYQTPDDFWRLSFPDSSE